MRAIFVAAGMYVNLAFYIQKLTDNVSRFDSDGIVGEFKREKHINMAPVSAMHWTRSNKDLRLHSLDPTFGVPRAIAKHQ